jgi:nitric-oxide synthase
MSGDRLVGWVSDFAAETGRSPQWVRERVAAIRDEHDATCTWTHIHDEAATAALVAWRNSARCIGRLYWRSLVVRDRRGATTAAEIAYACIEHLEFSTNVGRIRHTLTLFPPAGPDGVVPRIWNEQLVRYAGYRQDDGSVVGDPRNVEFTDRCRALGWRGDGGHHDLLPLAIQLPGAQVELFDVPPSAVLEVAIHHPEHPWFADLGIRWHALPAISSMRLDAYGLDYTAAPFSGWYMGTEIGARNLADADRYNLLPRVATHLGLDTSDDRTLWKDRALVELNRAVLWSFDRAGVSMSDHHSESQRFLLFLEAMARSGHAVPTDWSWVVAPMSSATLPTFHRYYDHFDPSPNFHAQPTLFDPRFAASPSETRAAVGM